MPQFAIIETEDGMTVAAIPPALSAEDVARQRAAVVIDPGPYPTYQEAYEALLAYHDPEDDDN